MTPAEHRRIREIYEMAQSISGSAERAACLDRECQGNETIREEVERLLKAHDSVPTWLDRPAAGAAPVLPKLEGRHLGGYTLIREIGRGGMGTVYLAERSDDTFHRQAAIKLVLPPANSAAVIARFHHEREILASLDHPNIAKLLDAGVTEEGWPYFVMEYVDGQSIHRWCDERKLSISQRVELFRGVIDAVRYAHQRLVVHRDLKPGNILVTNDGMVKLLDFGIAKVLSPPAAGQAADTVTLSVMLTPEYASPEQVNGTAITTLSDVYSLGVVLYELLTGHRPYRLSSAAMHEMARVIAEVEPVRPSEAVSATLRKQLAGDLDSILLMALRKEPQRRYASAESLAEDLQRHLDQRPVNAREATPWERFDRFRRRNPGGMAAGALIAILLLTGLGAVVWQARHDMQATQVDPTFRPFVVPLWMFSYGIALAILYALLYFSGATSTAERLGVGASGLVWGVGMLGRWRLEHDLGWWRSRIAGNADPLELFSPWIWLLFVVAGAALLLGVVMIGRRFGRKGQVLAITILGIAQVTRERLWFGEIIPAIDFQPGAIPFLGSVTVFAAVTLLALLVMRWIGGPEKPREVSR